MFGSVTKLTFREFVQGTWGGFHTPAGRVDYIMTKARLGEDSGDPERLLTKSLAPVREVMNPDDLDFNQLLQRDLDDHRVAVKLIPYLLTPQPTGPAFFPPIVAVLLPFKNKRPSSFPDFTDPETIKEEDSKWEELRASDSFRVQRLLGGNGRLHGGNIGRLWWNPSEASLVVLDGQHRAMALLAIERTMSNSWQGSPGARFRSFYENQVKQCLADAQSQAKKDGRAEFDLSKVEVPVTVCWFPGQNGEQGRPHEAARKLFVDVNKEARPPSESRIILLSDSLLSNVLARSMLSDLRNQTDNSFLPLYAVEYDNPDAKSFRPTRWSVVTNINLFKAAVDRCIFGPMKYIENVGLTYRGRPKESDRDSCMRTQLELSSIFPAHFNDGGLSFERESLGDREFPLGQVEKISEQFSKTWGKAILTVLSQTRPYAAHAESLNRLKDQWSVADNYAQLAHDALFTGVGVFWTLKEGYEHFLESHNKESRTQVKPDVVRAWTTLTTKAGDFESIRAHEYLGSGSKESLKKSKSSYETFNTHACQLGLILTLGSLWAIRSSQQGQNASIAKLPDFAAAMADGINAYFDLEHGKAKDRRLSFSRESKNAINQVGNMESAQAVYFRYFWMQTLATPEAWSHIAPWFESRESFDVHLSKARRLYLNLLENQQEKAIRTSNPNMGKEKRESLAKEQASKILKSALKDWFAVSSEEYESWHQGTITIQPTLDADPDDERAETPDEIDEPSRRSPQSLDDFLTPDAD